MAKKTAAEREKSDIIARALRERLKCPKCGKHRWILKDCVMCPDHQGRDMSFVAKELRQLRKMFPALSSTAGKPTLKKNDLIEGFKKPGSYTRKMSANDSVFFDAKRQSKQD